MVVSERWSCAPHRRAHVADRERRRHDTGREPVVAEQRLQRCVVHPGCPRIPADVPGRVPDAGHQLAVPAGTGQGVEPGTVDQVQRHRAQRVRTGGRGQGEPRRGVGDHRCGPRPACQAGERQGGGTCQDPPACDGVSTDGRCDRHGPSRGRFLGQNQVRHGAAARNRRPAQWRTGLHRRRQEHAGLASSRARYRRSVQPGRPASSRRAARPGSCGGPSSRAVRTRYVASLVSLRRLLTSRPYIDCRSM